MKTARQHVETGLAMLALEADKQGKAPLARRAKDLVQEVASMTDAQLKETADWIRGRFQWLADLEHFSPFTLITITD